MTKNYKGRRVLIIGLARSGLAATKLLVRLGAKVTITDMQSAEELNVPVQELPREVKLILGGHESVIIADYNFAVISPGVPWESSLPTKLRDGGIELISELELAFTLISAPIIAITGSNGKSTTTTLIGEILKAWGKKVYIGGNIGSPLSGAVGGDYDFIVVEVSSFQLEGVKTFRPMVALLLNITPDHLDRHGTMDHYIELKLSLFDNQRKGDVAIINASDEHSTNKSLNPLVPVKYFSLEKKADEEIWVEGDSAILKKNNKMVELFKISDLNIFGPHNVENALAASLAAMVVGVDLDTIKNAIKTFSGLPHRMELVAEVDGIFFYNDSKATNPDAVIKSLAGFSKNVALIAGGLSKSSDFKPMAEAMVNSAKGVVLIGEAASELEAALGVFQPKVRATDMVEAVEEAAKWCRPGDSVVLSPGCASFDMFDNFQHRGDCFREAVNNYLGIAG
ncbi:MAG TPA: UDP-N-acetylmuramoyl-L-alanine--D-glutamate ligase [Nitrospinota bacterium]|nr:UDP-N-acetylmuramoyl-L-alanine--D-glutamate ligase [Nitrospinota bacterium]